MIDTKAVEAWLEVFGDDKEYMHATSPVVRYIRGLLEVYNAAAALLAAERGGSQNDFQAAWKALEEAMK